MMKVPATLTVALAVVFANFGPLTALAAGGAVETLAKAMSCEGEIEPENVLERLQQEGFIGSSPVAVMDGMPTFQVLKPLKILGLRVKFVTGWDYTGKFFKRAPGTAPGVWIEIVVEGDGDHVRQMASQALRKNVIEYDRDADGPWISSDPPDISYYTKQTNLARLICTPESRAR
jgi:hypothetical protein